MRSSTPARLVYETILPVGWLTAWMVAMMAVFWALVAGPSWTGGLLVALIVALSLTLRRRFEVDRTTGHIRVLRVASLAPGWSCVALKDLVHGKLGAFRYVQIQLVLRTVRGEYSVSTMKEYHVQLGHPTKLGFGQLASASDEQNAALAGVLTVFALGNRGAARRAAMQLAQDLELPLQEAQPGPPVVM